LIGDSDLGCGGGGGSLGDREENRLDARALSAHNSEGARDGFTVGNTLEMRSSSLR